MPRIHTVYGSPNGVDLYGSCTRIFDVTRTWVLNEVGSASFKIPFGTPNIDKICAHGALHWIYEDDVDPWVGYVVSRSYDAETVSVELRSAEGLLGHLVGRQGMIFGATSPVTIGYVAREVFLSGWRSARNASPLRQGTFDANVNTFKTYDYPVVLDVFQELSETTESAFWVDESLRVHFRKIRGTDRSKSVYLRQGADLLECTVHESSQDVLSAAVAIGGGGNDIVSRYKKALTVTPTGQFRAAVLSYNDEGDPEALGATLTEALRTSQYPSITIEGKLPKTSRFWKLVNIGDYVSVISYPPSGTWRDEHLCRVKGVEMSGTEDVKSLVLVVSQTVSKETPKTWTLS